MRRRAYGQDEFICPRRIIFAFPSYHDDYTLSAPSFSIILSCYCKTILLSIILLRSVYVFQRTYPRHRDPPDSVSRSFGLQVHLKQPAFLSNVRLWPLLDPDPEYIRVLLVSCEIFPSVSSLPSLFFPLIIRCVCNSSTFLFQPLHVLAFENDVLPSNPK